MKKQKILILLGIILIILIISLMIYAYYLSQAINPAVQNPTQTPRVNPSVVQQQKAQQLADIEKIKQEMAGINNQSFTTIDPSEISSDCSTEESKQYQEKVITGEAKVAEGLITEIGASFLKVNFQQDLVKWTSTVNLDAKTSLTTINKELVASNIKSSDLKVGNKIVVKTSGEKITDESFLANSIARME